MTARSNAGRALCAIAGHWIRRGGYGLAVGALAAALVSLAGCGGGSAKREAQVGEDLGGYVSEDFGASRQFPIPSQIKPNVDFWRHVYGIWSRNQVVFHDDEHMGVIYEVTRLPGSSSEGYGDYQRTWVQARLRQYQERLRNLENAVRAGQAPESADRELLAKLERAGGKRAVYGASDRVRVQRGMREKFLRGLEISGRYDSTFRDIMRANGLPEDLAYLPHVESSFQANARSYAGATGVWQFMPATGKIFMEVNGAVDERMDPILAAEGAARYLSNAHDKLHTWPLAITSYNHGVGGMANARAQTGDDIGQIVTDYKGPAFKFASRNYYAEFMAAREVASHPRRYFPEGVQYERPWSYERVVLHESTPAPVIAARYGVSTSTLAELNRHWREAARSGRTPLPGGTTVWVPSTGKARGIGTPPAYTESAVAYRSEPRSAPVSSAVADFGDIPRVEPAIARVEPGRAPDYSAVAVFGDIPQTRPTFARADTPKPAPIERAAPAAPVRHEPVVPARYVLPPEPEAPRIVEAPRPEPLRATRPQTLAPESADLSRGSASLARLDKHDDDIGIVEAEETEATKVAELPKPAKLAKAEDAKTAKGGKLAKAEDAKTAKGVKLAKAEDAKSAKGKTAKSDTGRPEKVARNDKGKGAGAPPKYHVVKAEETLYRVALINGISVDQLRKLNKLGPKDNHIQPGQKLKVEI